MAGKGIYSTLAGFVEAATKTRNKRLAREGKKRAGRDKIISGILVLSRGRLPAILDVGFFAGSGPITEIVGGDAKLAEVRWFRSKKRHMHRTAFYAIPDPGYTRPAI